MIVNKPVYDLSKQIDIDLRHDDYNSVYQTPHGKRVIEDLLYYAAVGRTAFCQKTADQTFFNLGKQSTGYYIISNITQRITINTKKREDE